MALKEVCEKVSLPVYALGGITWEKIKLCYKNGAHGVAGIGLFFDHVDSDWGSHG